MKPEQIGIAGSPTLIRRNQLIIFFNLYSPFPLPFPFPLHLHQFFVPLECFNAKSKRVTLSLSFPNPLISPWDHDSKAHLKSRI